MDRIFLNMKMAGNLKTNNSNFPPIYARKSKPHGPIQ